MKKFNISKFKIVVISLSFVSAVIQGWSQTVLYHENMGVPASNTLVQNYTGWENSVVLYSGDGTCDVRTSSASSGYGGASGGGNVMLNDTVKWFQFSGLNTSADTNLSLYCAIRKTNAENGSNFVVEVSADSAVWTRLFMEDTLPTGTGTSGWHRVRYRGVPSCANLHVRFSNLAHVDYRLDDIAIVVGEETVLETVSKPVFSPSGGTYYEPQMVTMTSPTGGADIFYTMDGSAPTTSSNRYLGPVSVVSSVTVKALAVHAGMYDSEVATASYVILDTNSVVTLPLDLSGNSDGDKSDITLLPGFRGYHLGSSYADGSAKFETAHAGEAALVAHLDSAPGSLAFELKGRAGGSAPAAYEGVLFYVEESADGQNWSSIVHLTENDISTDEFVRLGGYPLQESTRYVRWKLMQCNKGNTQLNNIVIDRFSGEDHDTTGVLDYESIPVCIYPNPTTDRITLHTGHMQVLAVTLLDLQGNVLQEWSAPFSVISLAQYPRGMYVLSVRLPQGVARKKVVRY